MSALCQGDDGLCPKEAEADGYCDTHHPGPPIDLDMILLHVESTVRPRLKHEHLRGRIDVDLVALADHVRVLNARLAAATPLLAVAALDASERRSWEQKIFALEDGLRGWKQIAADAEKRASENTQAKDILEEVSSAINAYDRDICGTLPERVNMVIGRATGRALGQKRTAEDCANEVVGCIFDNRLNREEAEKYVAEWLGNSQEGVSARHLRKALRILYRAVGEGYFNERADLWRNEPMIQAHRALERAPKDVIALEESTDRVLEAAHEYEANKTTLIRLLQEIRAYNALRSQP